MFFKNCSEIQEKIKALFTEALTLSLKVLPKVDDPGKFVSQVPSHELNSRMLFVIMSSVNLVLKVIIDKLDIMDVEPLQLTLVFVNSSTSVPYSSIRDLPV